MLIPNDVLQGLEVKSTSVGSFDYSEAKKVFNSNKEKYSTFDRKVHEHFFSYYYFCYDNEIVKAVDSIAESNAELLIQSFIGRLAHKLPAPHIDGYSADYYRFKAQLTIAGIIGHVLMDTEVFPSTVEVKRVEGRWETLTKIQFGGQEVKELLKGLHFKPGITYQKFCEGYKLNSSQKRLLKRLSSIPFKLSDIATPDLIDKGYSTKKDWGKRVDKHGKQLVEHPFAKEKRFEGYRDTIMALAGKTFYLELKYSGSGRMFYKLQLEGIRPQGKLWETLLIDSAEAYYLTEEQEGALQHLIYCGLEGVRVTPSEAIAKFTVDHLIAANNADLFGATNDDEFGERLLLRKASIALADSASGKPTHYMFGWDFTTSGLIVAGMSFHSHEMLEAGNMHMDDVVHDAHTYFNDMLSLGLERKDAKAIHMAALHGASLKGILKAVNNVRKEAIDEGELLERLRGVYGPCVDNLMTIADWGTKAISNTKSKLTWTLPDGFKATHKAYFESAEVVLTCVSCNAKHKHGKTTHTLISDMPYAVDNTGKALLPDTSVKVRGLYATITHSLDAYVLRLIAENTLDEGMPIKLKHDDFMIHPASYQSVLESARLAFSELYDYNGYVAAIEEIARYSNDNGVDMPVIIMSDADNISREATAFLMP